MMGIICGYKYFAWMLTLFVMFMSDINAAPMSNVEEAPDDTSEAEYVQNGQFLVDIGRNYSNPLLKLVGRTFEHYEKRMLGKMNHVEKQMSEQLCMLSPCTEWGSWTRCSEKAVDRFGMRTRSRNCSTGCADQETRNLPTLESNVCEGKCPDTYKYTNGYYLQLFKTHLAQSDAQAACEKDNGHLVNINSRDKSDSVHSVLKSHGITSHNVWINGKRTQAGGDWDYTYDSGPDFDNWYGNEPSNGSNELCKLESGSKRQWFDSACSSTQYYFCEVILM